MHRPLTTNNHFKNIDLNFDLCVTLFKMNLSNNPKGAGRKPLPIEEKTTAGSVRLTPARWVKLRLLGAAWLAMAIDRARLPTK